MNLASSAWGLNQVYSRGVEGKPGTQEPTGQESRTLWPWGAAAGAWSLHFKPEQCFLARSSLLGLAERRGLFLQLEPGQAVGSANHGIPMEESGAVGSFVSLQLAQVPLQL